MPITTNPNSEVALAANILKPYLTQHFGTNQIFCSLDIPKNIPGVYRWVPTCLGHLYLRGYLDRFPATETTHKYDYKLREEALNAKVINLRGCKTG